MLVNMTDTITLACVSFHKRHGVSSWTFYLTWHVFLLVLQHSGQCEDVSRWCGRTKWARAPIFVPWFRNQSSFVNHNGNRVSPSSCEEMPTSTSSADMAYAKAIIYSNYQLSYIIWNSGILFRPRWSSQSLDALPGKGRSRLGSLGVIPSKAGKSGPSNLLLDRLWLHLYTRADWTVCELHMCPPLFLEQFRNCHVILGYKKAQKVWPSAQKGGHCKGQKHVVDKLWHNSSGSQALWLSGPSLANCDWASQVTIFLLVWHPKIWPPQPTKHVANL
jgi:hypothetical protein